MKQIFKLSIAIIGNLGIVYLYLTQIIEFRRKRQKSKDAIREAMTVLTMCRIRRPDIIEELLKEEEFRPKLFELASNDPDRNGIAWLKTMGIEA